MAANDNWSNRKPAPPAPPEPSNNRGNVVALVAVVIVAAALFWTVSAIQKHNAVQDCIDIPQGQGQ